MKEALSVKHGQLYIPQKSSVKSMPDGKKIAILVEEDFEDSELIEPLRTMKNAGVDWVRGE